MKKLLVMLVLGVMVSGVSYAQEGPKKERKHKTEYRGKKAGKEHKKSAEERAGMRTEKMSKQLGLNKSQTAKLQALNLKQAREMEAMHAKNVTPGEHGQERREAMKARHTQWEKELKGILTKDQYAKYEAERQQMRSRSAKGENDRGKEFMKRREARMQQSS